MDSESSHNHPSTSSTSATPQVRSRITVVCAECKRLKLKCDRRNPCGSCVKRDTTVRCIYSPAAAEKVDLHSLNNRLIQVETLLAQLTSGQFTSSFPTSNSWPPQQPPPSAGIAASTSTSSDVAQNPPSPLPYTSLALSLDDVAHIWLDHLDVGTRVSLQCSGFSTDASALNGVKIESHPPSFTSEMEPHESSSTNLAELSIHSRSTKPLPPTTLYYLTATRPHDPANLPFPSHPPPADSQATQLKPVVTQALLDLLPPHQSAGAGPNSLSSLLSLAEQSTFHTYPSINWKQFRARASRMMATSYKTTPFSPSSPGTSKNRDRDKDKIKGRNRRDTELTRDSYPMPRMSNGNPLPPFNPSSALPAQDGSDPCIKVEGVPFFGAVCAALALGALEASREGSNMIGDAMIVDSYPSCGPSSRGSSSGTYLDAEYWYRLSVQALAEYERGLTVNVKTKAKAADEFGLDYLVTCLFQVAFLVKGGLGHVSLESTDTYLGHSIDAGTASKRRKDKDRDRPNDRTRNFSGVAAIIFPMVGKMVNIARKMGLGKDPHEILVLPDASGSAKKPKNPNKSEVVSPAQPRAISNLYDAEMRRRVWWDVLYYDVFVSDALGHEPLIGDDFNTKMPVGDVDERIFSPVSTTIPVPQDLDMASGYSRHGFQHFRVKCRLALLVRTIQRRMCASELSTSLFNYGSATSFASKNGYGYSIDQAASMEAEVTRWLEDLPPCYRLEKSTIDLSSVDPILASQRCELVITAQRLILKVYMPFLRKHASVSETVPAPHQATCGSVNAAHLIIRACSLLNAVWKGQGRESMPSASSLSSALFDLYPVTRILFDAAIVCAHAAIKQTMPVMATAAEEALNLAFEIFQDQHHWSQLGGVNGMGGAHAVSVKDALQLLNELKQQAVTARGAMGPYLKRKHIDVDEEADEANGDQEGQDSIFDYSHETEEQVQPVFDDLLPPPSVPESSVTSAPSPLLSFRDEAHIFPRFNSPSLRKEDKSKKPKKSQYPAFGIRVRTPKESPVTRRRLSPPSPILADRAQLPQDSNLAVSTQSYQTPPLQSHHDSASSAVPSPLSAMSHMETERYRSRSSSLSQPVDSRALSRRDSATDASYPPFPAANSPHPEGPPARRYTVANYHSVPPPVHSPIVQSQSQPLAGTYGVASQSTVIYDRASSYDSQRGYTASAEAYAPAQSPYPPSNSPYATTSGPLSSASSPYTNTTTTTPTYPSPQSQSGPVSASSQGYYSYEPAPGFQNTFANEASGSYSPEGMADVKPSVDIERYPPPTQSNIYHSQSQWQNHPPPQQQQQQQYWTQETSGGNYYPH